MRYEVLRNVSYNNSCSYYHYSIWPNFIFMSKRDDWTSLFVLIEIGVWEKTPLGITSLLLGPSWLPYSRARTRLLGLLPPFVPSPSVFPATQGKTLLAPFSSLSHSSPILPLDPIPYGRCSPHSLMHSSIPNIRSSQPLLALLQAPRLQHEGCLCLRHCYTTASQKTQAKRQVWHPFIGKSCKAHALSQAVLGAVDAEIRGPLKSRIKYFLHMNICMYSIYINCLWTKCTKAGNRLWGEELRGWEEDFTSFWTIWTLDCVNVFSIWT